MLLVPVEKAQDPAGFYVGFSRLHLQLLMELQDAYLTTHHWASFVEVCGVVVLATAVAEPLFSTCFMVVPSVATVPTFG